MQKNVIILIKTGICIIVCIPSDFLFSLLMNRGKEIVMFECDRTTILRYVYF